MTAVLETVPPPPPVARRRRRWLAALLLLSVLVAGGAAWVLRPGPLLLSEEFDGDRLDDDVWGTCYPYRATHCTNEYNGEQQVYVPEAVTVEGGALRLTARTEQTEGFREDGSRVTLPHSSGMVSTSGRFSFTYGYVEFSARVVEGQGLWPALWLLPEAGWPPEIDVMEFIGSQPDRVYMTHHPEGAPAVSAAHVGPRFAEGVHTFAVDWRPGSITWYVDGVERHRTTVGVPDEPMYLLANLAVGGAWPGPPDGSTRFPATFSVERVQVWEDRAAWLEARE